MAHTDTTVGYIAIRFHENRARRKQGLDKQRRRSACSILPCCGLRTRKMVIFHMYNSCYGGEGGDLGI